MSVPVSATVAPAAKAVLLHAAICLRSTCQRRCRILFSRIRYEHLILIKPRRAPREREIITYTFFTAMSVHQNRSCSTMPRQTDTLQMSQNTIFIQHDYTTCTPITSIRRRRRCSECELGEGVREDGDNDMPHSSARHETKDILSAQKVFQENRANEAKCFWWEGERDIQMAVGSCTAAWTTRNEMKMRNEKRAKVKTKQKKNRKKFASSGLKIREANIQFSAELFASVSTIKQFIHF